MTKDELSESAKALQDEGLSYSEIGRRLGKRTARIARLLDSAYDARCKEAAASYRKLQGTKNLTPDASPKHIRICLMRKLHYSKAGAKKGDYQPCTATVEQLIESFTDTCQACGRQVGYDRIRMEHCHKTGRFRGWTCNPCNVILGQAQDNPEILRRLIIYLTKSEVASDAASGSSNGNGASAPKPRPKPKAANT